MYILVLWTAKVIQFITRKSGHGGAALPGLFVEKISKNFLGHYLQRIPGGVIVISGTNGKTTTTKLMVEAIEKKGKRVFTNRSGSNMTRGLISAVISHATLRGYMPYDIAVLEIDEAYAAKFVENLPVRGAVILNVMRDQLDRFGEIDTTARYLGALTSASREFVVLNASDPRVRDLPTYGSAEKIYFGVSGNLKSKIISDDNWHAGSEKHKSDKADYLLNSSSGNVCVIAESGEEYKFTSNLSGAHNHLNITAVVAALGKLGIYEDTEEIINIVKTVSPAFGRGEVIVAGHATISLQLVKNPSSFTQTVESCNLDEFDKVAIVINDAHADSRDVSWLWDVDFENFKSAKYLLASGTRAYDLAVRLKHSGIKTDNIIMEERALAEYLMNQKGNHVIFCTYTAMLNLRKIFVKKGHLEKVL